jgi:hypothetical protein
VNSEEGGWSNVHWIGVWFSVQPTRGFMDDWAYNQFMIHPQVDWHMASCLDHATALASCNFSFFIWLEIFDKIALGTSDVIPL